MDYQSTFDEALIGIAHATLDGQFLLVNRYLTKMLGYTADELTLLDFKSITHPDDVAQEREARAQLIGGTVSRYAQQRRCLRKDGTIVFANLTVTLHRDASGARDYFIVMIEDLTERKQLEQQVCQAQKMEAIGRLASSIAHDFNNVLTAIIGYAELAIEQLRRDSHSVCPDVEEIRAAANTAAELTRQLLTFSRKQVVERRIIDFNTVVERARGLLDRLTAEHVDIHWKLGPAGRISADACQIEQVVVNLAINARDAMPDGGVLTIETSAVDIDSAYAAKHPGTRVGPHVLLRVSDTGVGMNEATKDRLFEPFFTTKATGTGLGLATVCRIVEQSGGSIAVESTVGAGTTVAVYLPCQSSQATVSTPLNTATVLRRRRDGRWG